MGNKRRTTPIKSPAKLEKCQGKVEVVQHSNTRALDKLSSTRQVSRRERKLTLQQDVDRLKKKLRLEENIHRALERAFTRPLGSLPRLPSYLPPNILELLAEVAVLEEEVVRLEEEVVLFRNGLHQEAVHISPSKQSVASLLGLYVPNLIRGYKPENKYPVDGSFATSSGGHQSCDGSEKESQCHMNSLKSKQAQLSHPIQAPRKKSSLEKKELNNHSDAEMPQLEGRTSHQGYADAATPTQEDRNSQDDCPNTLSENIIKSFITIFLRMRRTKSRSIAGQLPSLSSSCDSEKKVLQDPYDICTDLRRDVGPYKTLCSIHARCINPSRTTSSVFLVRRVKILLGKLASVKLGGLTHQEKLAFWINVYNSCMMNAFIEHGIPESPDTVVTLMQKATINVGGHMLSPITIEHFILRLPYHSKYNISKEAKSDEMAARTIFGLELSEPLVTFALCCGSWSSPAVRVYTASKVEDELELAKREYLQAAVGISKTKKLLVPKVLDWYLLDFAKDLESLLDWICLQLPASLRKEAMKCIESVKDESLSQHIRFMPYEYSFRYLLHAQ